MATIVDKSKYDPSIMNAVTGILSLPGEIDRQADISGAVKRGAGKIAQNLKTNLGIMGDAAGMVAKSATGQIGAQAMSDKYVNPPGGLNMGGALALAQPVEPTMWTGGISKPTEKAALTPAGNVQGGLMAPSKVEPVKAEPERTPIDTGGMGRANTIPQALSKINAGIDQGSKYDTSRDTVIEQPGAGFGLRTWKDEQGRTHIEGGGSTGNVGGVNGQPRSPGSDRAAAISQKIDTMINDLVGAQEAKYGKGKFSKLAVNMITTLRGQQLGLGGHEVTAEATRQGHTEAAKDRAELARERITAENERFRESNNTKLLQIKQVEAAGQDARELKRDLAKDKQFQTDYTKAGTDPLTKEFDSEKGYFELGFAGSHSDREEVKRAFAPFEARLKAATKGKTPTEQQKQMARDAWYKEKRWMK